MSQNAYRDENSVPTKIAVSNSDGVTIVRTQANSSTHRLLVNNGTTGSNFGIRNAHRDENDVPVLLAVSSGDGRTPIELYIDPLTHRLLINSN